MGNEVRIAWYGKHPAWKDYVSGSFEPPSAQPLRDWIKLGRDHLARTAPGVEESGDCLYLFSPAAGDQLYCGIIGPSSDGLRQFPFTLFLPIPRRRYRRAYPLLPAYAAPAWETMRSAQKMCLAAHQSPEVEKILADLAPAIPAPSWGAWRRFRKDLGRVSASDFIGTLHPGGDAAAPGMLMRLAESLAPFRNGRLGPPPLAFDLPISGVLKTAAFQAAFWLRVCESTLGNQARMPSLFLYSRPQGMRLGIYLREPDPSDYALVMAGVGDPGRIHHLDAEGQPAAGGERPQPVEEALRGARTVADLFAHRWERLMRGSR